MKKVHLTQRELECIRHFNTPKPCVIRSHFNVQHYLKVKKYRDGIEKN